jgi:maleate isomerase
MTDSLGYRKKFGVIAPSTNTCVQPEFEAMRPHGVTNHFGRIHIPNDPIRDDDEFNQLMDNIRKEMLHAVDQVMTCEPDYLIMGMSSETFWDGLEGSKKLRQRVEERAGVKVRGEAARRDHPIYAGRRRPGPPLLRRLRFRDRSHERVEMREPGADRARVRARAARRHPRGRRTRRRCHHPGGWLDKPVLAINTCIYWWSLRQNGIDDRIDGFGSLLLEH